jgi:hypothetical protein
MPSPEPEFDVALSFAGEQRDYVRAVESELTKAGVSVFFDENEAIEISLWGKNLAEELQRVYMTASNVVVMFISEDYANKAWPTHERRSAITKAIDLRREYILPVRFDDAVLPGLDPSMSYLPLTDRPPAKLAQNIIAKLVQLGGKVVPPKPAFRAGQPGDAERKVCVVSVHDEHGLPVASAKVVSVATNGTTSEGLTDTLGNAEVPATVRRNVAIFVAHPEHRAAYHREHDNGTDLHVTLPAGAGTHSVIFGSTGHFPGFNPRLNPIGDYHTAEGVPRRTYMYVTNGSVNGKADQPFHFQVGTPMIVEDGEGNQVRATCVGFVGRSSVWEYEYP